MAATFTRGRCEPLRGNSRIAAAATALFTIVLTFFSTSAGAQTNGPDKPTWWNKYEYLAAHGPDTCSGANGLQVGANVDVSNECGPQSETYMTINPARPRMLAAGSNEIFRLPMRGYFSSDAGVTWGGVDLPLPPAKGNGIDFGSDPSLAFDTLGNVFYSYIVVYFGNGNGINGTAMGVARSSDGGRTYPQFTLFSAEGGSGHFNDKPMIAADTNAASPFRDSIYVAWDAATGGSTGGGVRFARSTDHGVTFTTTRIDDPHGQGRAIGAVPFVGPNGEVYAAWNDYAANTIAFNRSRDGGVTWDTPRVVASKQLAFDIAIPAESVRGALVYPACDADRSAGPHRGRLSCAWMDLRAGYTDIFASYSDDQGASWSTATPATDQLAGVDRFNHWLAVDPVTGDVNISFYDTRNDTTGARRMTDIYFTQSRTGGTSWLSPNLRVTDVSSNEHDCGDGVVPCAGINYGNQQGDYAGLASYGGVSHPIWTDSRNQLDPLPGCRTGLAMEEVFTATIASPKR